MKQSKCSSFLRLFLSRGIVTIISHYCNRSRGIACPKTLIRWTDANQKAQQIAIKLFASIFDFADALLISVLGHDRHRERLHNKGESL